ncbi:MAG: hypothetical protein ACRDKA_05940 [Actinomycetota bacterium]
MGAGDLSDAPTEPVSVDTVFDRFPASVRGAVVVRAVDREPHQVQLIEVEVVEAHDPRRGVQPVAVDRATVDLAPHREVLIPFDVPFSGLEPGWYCVVAEIEVDGSLRTRGPEGGGRRFVVAWPSAEVRRADLRPNLRIGGAIVERIECKPDRTAVRWRPGDTREQLRVTADKRRLPTVEVTDDPKTGARVTVAHPTPKRAEGLTLELARGRQKASARVSLP